MKEPYNFAFVIKIRKYMANLFLHTLSVLHIILIVVVILS